eukprot:scaffold60517_cov63-Phaeocystis_antarctica.AAC.1
MKGCRAVAVPDAAHHLHLQQPDAVWAREASARIWWPPVSGDARVQVLPSVQGDDLARRFPQRDATSAPLALPRETPRPNPRV